MSFLSYVGVLMPTILKGLVCTVELFIITIGLAVPLGLPIALGRMSRFLPLKLLCGTYIWVFRGTPLILQLFFFYFFLPITVGLRLDAFPTAAITFVLNYAAYLAEIYRGGIQSIDRGQYEAAKSLGVSHWRTTKDIILPQAISRVLPPVSNEAITLVKDTALVSVIAVPEMLKAAKDAVNRDVNPTAYLVAAVCYLLLTFLLTLLSQKLEKRFSRHLAKEEA